MTMVCQVCNSYNRPDLEKDLMRGLSYSKLAIKYDLDAQAIRNHHLNHLSRQLVQAWERKQDAESRDLLGEIDELIERTKTILDKAEKQNKLKTALAGIRELRGSYELLSRIAFSLHQAKEKDIELARIESGKTAYQEMLQYRKELEILLLPELKLFGAILNKLHTQDPDSRPIGEALSREMIHLYWLEQPEEYEKAFNPLGIQYADFFKPLTVPSIESLGIDPLEFLGIDPLELIDPDLDPDPDPDPPMKRTKKPGPGRPPGSKNKRKPFVRKKRTPVEG